jgi:Acetyltransferase (GNAT) domain
LESRISILFVRGKEWAMQRYEIISPAPRKLWRAAFLADSTALLTHTPEWLDTICAVDGYTDSSRLYIWPSGRHLVLPMVGKGVGGFTVLEESYPQGWGFGGLVGGAVTPDEAAAVWADVAPRRLLRQRICLNPLQGSAWEQALARRPSGAKVIPRRAHVVDLDGGTGAIWKRFSENARRCVRKAEKQTLEVECDTTGRLLGVFHKLLDLSTRRWAAQDGKPAWFVRWRTHHANPSSRWRQIIKRVMGGAAIWVAYHRGEPAAAIIVLQGPSDHYIRGAMDHEIAAPTRAAFLLQWLAIQDAFEKECP